MEKQILTKNQIAFLERLQKNKFFVKNFYLAGGTALAAFYLQHRYSEDLDFFSEAEIDVFQLDIFLKTLRKDLQITSISFENSFNRNIFFLSFGKEVLKTEFTYFPFPRIQKGRKEYGIEIDSLEDIATNKLFTIYQRTQARDYIDLYFICREHGFSIDDLLKNAKAKFDWHIDPVQLGAQFLKATQAKDYPRMIKKLPDKEWHDFFIKEVKKLRGRIVEN
jgi:predicted nucleotidyltransferase component of viral defense system